jgi:hypothetical protein
MTPEKKTRGQTLREFYEAIGDKSAVWINDNTGQIIDSLEVESPIPELQSTSARYAITTAQQRRIDQQPRSIDLVGRTPDRQHMVTTEAPTNPAPRLPDHRPVLLLGKRGGP